MAQKMDMLLAEAGPVRADGNASVITDVRRSKQKGTQVFLPREHVRITTWGHQGQ